MNEASCCNRGLFCGLAVSGRDSDAGVESADFGGVLTLTYARRHKDIVSSSALYKDKSRGKVCIPARHDNQAYTVLIQALVMANLLSNLPLFRHVPGIEQLEEDRLNELGYYRGFPCPHNHLIRDSTNHWCYECANKILSNVCGFDINYLNAEYRIKYGKLWNSVQIGFPEDCWEIKGPTGTTPKRVCMPSYRSEYSKQKSDNVNVHKAIYQCAWGDVGDLKVTRLCANPKCANPLHLVSSFNRNFPPKTISPLEVEFKAEKLMLYHRRQQQGLDMQPLNRKEHKNAITNPEYVKDREE